VAGAAGRRTRRGRAPASRRASRTRREAVGWQAEQPPATCRRRPCSTPLCGSRPRGRLQAVRTSPGRTASLSLTHYRTSCRSWRRGGDGEAACSLRPMVPRSPCPSPRQANEPAFPAVPRHCRLHPANLAVGSETLSAIAPGPDGLHPEPLRAGAVRGGAEGAATNQGRRPYDALVNPPARPTTSSRSGMESDRRGRCPVRHAESGRRARSSGKRPGRDPSGAAGRPPKGVASTDRLFGRPSGYSPAEGGG